MNKTNPLHWPRLGCGAGLRKEHLPQILQGQNALSWLEVISENHMDSRGLPRKHLLKLRQDYPLVFHGVSLSIASTDPLNWPYLKVLKGFIRELEPELVSDHLCWTGSAHENMHQLLPLPRTEECLRHIIKRIQQMQDFLGRRMLFENISTYLDFSESEFPEWQFVKAIAEESDSGILLDINNLFINAHNHGYSAEEYIHEIPRERVGQFHLAGHREMGEGTEKFLFDSHHCRVIEPVWRLYQKALQQFGPVSTLVEWDEDIPEFSVLEDEVKKAKALLQKGLPDLISEVA